MAATTRSSYWRIGTVTGLAWTQVGGDQNIADYLQTNVPELAGAAADPAD